MIYFFGRMIIRLLILLELFSNNVLHLESSWAKIILIAVVFPVLGKCVQSLKKNYPEMISLLGVKTK